MKVRVSIEFDDAAEAYRYVGLLPGAGAIPLPTGGSTFFSAPLSGGGSVPLSVPDPFADPKPEPSQLILNHTDKITEAQLNEVCTAKAQEFKAAGGDGLPIIKKLISEYGQLGKGLNAIHDSRRAAFKSAVEALVP